MNCPPGQFVHILMPATKVPGNCCPKYACRQGLPRCYSENLKQYFQPQERWDEDSCTQCECNEFGEKRCETSHCTPLSCEDKQYIDGQCCPVCDISNSKFCAPHEICDIHCLNYVHDAARNCTQCRCAPPPTKTNSSSPGDVVNRPTSSSDWNDSIPLTPSSPPPPPPPRSTPTTDSFANYTWIAYLFLGICITTGAFAIIMGISCRHICHQKGKHTLTHKQNTPLI